MTNSDASASFESPAVPTNNLHFVGKITDLKTLPSAQHIQRIYPSTITVDLIVGIITISPPRTVRLRKRNGEMDIVEVLVGDETFAGFQISFWLLPQNKVQTAPSDDPRQSLKMLRSGDVVFLRNVALSAFRNCVYGQSLSRRIARNSTTIMKIRGATETKGIVPLDRDKLAKVEKWRDDFVGKPIAAARQKDTKRSRDRLEHHHTAVLPPDTQD